MKTCRCKIYTAYILNYEKTHANLKKTVSNVLNFQDVRIVVYYFFLDMFFCFL